MKKIALIVVLFMTVLIFIFCVKPIRVYRHLDTAKGMFDKGIDQYVYGEYRQAIKTFEEILEKFPDAEKERAWAQYEIGFCYFHLLDYDKAVEAFRKVLDEYTLRAPRVLAGRMIEKIRRGFTNKRSTYIEN